MTSIDNLDRITILCVAFKKALESDIGQDKIEATFQPAEKESLDKDIEELSSYALALASCGVKPTEDFLKSNIAVVEKVTDISLRILSEEKVSSYIPSELKNEEDIKALSDLGAKKLAKLCKLK